MKAFSSFSQVPLQLIVILRVISFKRRQKFTTYEESCKYCSIYSFLHDIVKARLESPSFVSLFHLVVPHHQSRNQIRKGFYVPPSRKNYGQNEIISCLTTMYNKAFSRIDIFANTKHLRDILEK